MVEVEVGVARGGEKITSGVATDSVVTSGVHTKESIREVALHAGRKGGEVFVVGDQINNLSVGRPDGRSSLRDVAAEAARVVTQAIEGGVGFHIGEDRVNGAEVNGEAE